jgi:outer membrane protein assembly factor BamE (lipoprotein component of BamABCDE complex)
MFSLKLTDRLAIAAISGSILFTGVALAWSAPARAETASSMTTYGAQRNRLPTADMFETIRPGMTASDVLERLGKPYNKSRFPATKTTAWDYRMRDFWNYDADFSVILDDQGIVVSKIVVRNGQ